MTILLVTKTLGYRGTERALFNYAHLLSSKYKILVWGYDAGGETYDRLKKDGFEVYKGLDSLSLLISLKPDIINIHRAGVYQKKETEIIRKFREIGCRCLETNVFGRVDWSIESLIDISIQISRWDLYRWNAWKGKKYRVTGVLFPNPIQMDELLRASTTDITELRSSWQCNEMNGERCFVLGRIGKTNWKWLAKPLYNALEAFNNLHFVNVLDYSGEEMPSWLSTHPRVHNYGRIIGSKSLSLFYSACDACVNMSWNGESFGYVNAESMACGTPVIALSTPYYDNAQVEMICKEDGGIVMGRPHMLKDAIYCIMTNINRSLMQDRLRDSITKRYSMNVLFPILDKIIECVMAKDIKAAINQAEIDGVIITAVPRNEIFLSLKSVIGGIKKYELVVTRCLHSVIMRKVITFWKCVCNFMR